MTVRAMMAFTGLMLVLTFTAFSSLAQDEALDGEALYTERGCIYCHGPAGREPALPDYPKLDGQNEDYLVQQMKDIKSRARDNGCIMPT